MAPLYVVCRPLEFVTGDIPDHCPQRSGPFQNLLAVLIIGLQETHRMRRREGGLGQLAMNVSALEVQRVFKPHNFHGNS